MSAISIIVPTLGLEKRPTLADTLLSLSRQMTDADEVIVVRDGPGADNPDGTVNTRVLVHRYDNAYRGDWRYAELDPAGGCWGHPAANHGLNLATRPLVWRLDDDDIATHEALKAIRSAEDGRVSIFKMHFGDGHYAHDVTLWREDPPQMRRGEIGTPMIVAPPGDARFGSRYEGDLDYVEALAWKLGEPVWREECVAIIRPVAVEA